MSHITPPVVTVQMLIRRPAADVFRAFVDPSVTTRFWFTRSSGPLEVGKEVRWDWEMYGVGTTVLVKEIEPDRRILVEWDEPRCPLEWRFDPRPDGTTFVTITTWGFQGTDDEIVEKAIDSKGGFTFVVAGLKALLEHGVELGLVGDHQPDARVDAGG